MQQNRFKDAPWFKHAKNVRCIIGGAGGIGSWVAFFLARIGYNIKVYDFDHVEEHNLGGQLFMNNSVGKPKVDALLESISKFNLYSSGSFIACENNINELPYLYRDDTIFISCFDNMEARKILFERFKEEATRMKCAFIDGRLLMEQMQIFFMHRGYPERIKEYEEKYLFDDSEVEELPCSMKQTSHSAAMIASHMVGMITNYTFNLACGQELLRNPFYYEFIIPTSNTTMHYDREIATVLSNA